MFPFVSSGPKKETGKGDGERKSLSPLEFIVTITVYSSDTHTPHPKQCHHTFSDLLDSGFLFLPLLLFGLDSSSGARFTDAVPKQRQNTKHRSSKCPFSQIWGASWSFGFHVFISHPIPSSLGSTDTSLGLYYYILALLSAVAGHFPCKNHTPLEVQGWRLA